MSPRPGGGPGQPGAGVGSARFKDKVESTFAPTPLGDTPSSASPRRKPPHLACDGHKRRSSGQIPAESPSCAPAHSGTHLQSGRAVRAPGTDDWPWI